MASFATPPGQASQGDERLHELLFFDCRLHELATFAGAPGLGAKYPPPPELPSIFPGLNMVRRCAPACKQVLTSRAYFDTYIHWAPRIHVIGNHYAEQLSAGIPGSRRSASWPCDSRPPSCYRATRLDRSKNWSPRRGGMRYSCTDSRVPIL